MAEGGKALQARAARALMSGAARGTVASRVRRQKQRGGRHGALGPSAALSATDPHAHPLLIIDCLPIAPLPVTPDAALLLTLPLLRTRPPQAELDAEVAHEAGFPWGTLVELTRTWLVVMGLSLLKGGHGAPSLLGVKCGTL